MSLTLDLDVNWDLPLQERCQHLLDWRRRHMNTLPELTSLRLWASFWFNHSFDYKVVVQNKLRRRAWTLAICISYCLYFTLQNYFRLFLSTRNLQLSDWIIIVEFVTLKWNVKFFLKQLSSLFSLNCVSFAIQKVPCKLLVKQIWLQKQIFLLMSLYKPLYR